jgi:flagellar biogenesis protein FliO
MKFPFSKLIMLLVVWVAFTPLAFAQNAQNTQGEKPAANSAVSEPMSDDDKLPFMHQEETQSSDTVSTGGLIFKTFGAMLVVVGLIFFGAWGLKKLGFAGTKAGAVSDAPELTIVSSVTVGNGRTISSVKFGNRILLVGSTPQSFTLLADGPDDIDGADAVFPLTASSATPRSVADMLADEDSFEKEFIKADNGLISLFGGRA